MSTLTKNILINAAKTTNQNPEKTIELAGDLLNKYEKQKIRDAMESGNPLDWKTIDHLF